MIEIFVCITFVNGYVPVAHTRIERLYRLIPMILVRFLSAVEKYLFCHLFSLNSFRSFAIANRFSLNGVLNFANCHSMPLLVWYRYTVHNNNANGINECVYWCINRTQVTYTLNTLKTFFISHFHQFSEFNFGHTRNPIQNSIFVEFDFSFSFCVIVASCFVNQIVLRWFSILFDVSLWMKCSESNAMQIINPLFTKKS